MQSDMIKARFYYYEFFSLPLFFIDEKKFGDFKAQLSFLAENPLSTKEHFENLLKFDYENFTKEQNDVLYDFSYTNVPLTSSFYDEGRDDGQKRVKITEILLKSKFRKSEFCKDSEDFIGFIFAFMSEILKSGDLNLSYELFKEIINEFIDEFILMLKEHERADFFSSYAKQLDEFIGYERAILNIQKPVQLISRAKQAIEKIPHQTKLATPKSKIFWDEFSQINDEI